jgi:hypothetical protein
MERNVKTNAKNTLAASVEAETEVAFNVQLTLVDVDDVGVLDGGHDLDLPPDPDEVRLRLYLALLDRLDRNLGEIVDRNEELSNEHAQNDRLDGSLKDSSVRRFY